MSETVTATFASVAREAELALAEARAADPELDRRIDEFLEDADGAGLRVVCDLQPRAAFRLEIVRRIGTDIQGLVLREIAPPPRDATRSQAH